MTNNQPTEQSGEMLGDQCPNCGTIVFRLENHLPCPNPKVARTPEEFESQVLSSELIQLRAENEALKQQNEKLREALEGALVLADLYFESQGLRHYSNDNYCRIKDALKKEKQ